MLEIVSVYLQTLSHFIMKSQGELSVSTAYKNRLPVNSGIYVVTQAPNMNRNKFHVRSDKLSPYRSKLRVESRVWSFFRNGLGL